MGHNNLSKNDRGSMMIAKYNTTPGEVALRGKSPAIAQEFDAAMRENRYGKAWRMLLALNMQFEPRPAPRK